MLKATGYVKQGVALVRDWAAPGEALTQWTHFVTSVCNARCEHCFYPINSKKNELTLEEIDKLTRTLPPIRMLLLSGGEPFLRRDIVELIRLYQDRCRPFTVSIPTNGYSAAQIVEKTREICAISPTLNLGVAVSLDGFEAYHDRVRAVPGLYRRALECLEALLALSRSTPNLTVGVLSVFMHDNQHDLEKFSDFIYERYRPDHHGVVFIRGNPFAPAQKEGLDVDLYVRLCEISDSRYPTDSARTGWKGMRTRARAEINRQRYAYIARQAKGGGFEKFCLAGQREFILSEDGTVYGCELIDQPLGNVRDVGYDFNQIRKSGAACTFVDSKHERLCRCTHEVNIRTMFLFDRSNILPVVSAAVGLPVRRSA